MARLNMELSSLTAARVATAAEVAAFDAAICHNVARAARAWTTNCHLHTAATQVETGVVVRRLQGSVRRSRRRRRRCAHDLFPRNGGRCCRVEVPVRSIKAAALGSDSLQTFCMAMHLSFTPLLVVFDGGTALRLVGLQKSAENWSHWSVGRRVMLYSTDRLCNLQDAFGLLLVQIMLDDKF